MQWASAVEKAQASIEELRSALDELESLRNEYEEWQGNLPDNLQSGPLAEKLDAVVGLDFDVLGDVDQVISEAEEMDLPQGFGRD